MTKNAGLELLARVVYLWEDDKFTDDQFVRLIRIIAADTEED